MVSEHPFYRELAGLVAVCLPGLRRTARKRLVWFLAGILLAESIVLSRISAAQASRGGGSSHVESHERRLRRLENDPALTWQACYAPAVRRLLRWKPSQPIYLIVDESGHTDQVRLLMAALWYRGRAIPLAWVQRPFALPADVRYWDVVRQLLDRVKLLLPATRQVIVIADRAFGNPAFTDLVTASGWDWVVRVQGQTRFLDCRGVQRPLRDFVPTPGRRWRGRGRVFRKSGWRTARVVAFWDVHHREPLLVASSRPLSWELLQIYGLRGAIECLFRDWKSGGWQWEESHVCDPAHRERLWLGMAWATLITLCAGQQVAQELEAQPPRRRRTVSHLGKQSLFRLGLDRVSALWTQTGVALPSWQLGLHYERNWQDQIFQDQRRAFIFA